MIEYFPSFRDECEYRGRRVSFYKRAQILVADLWSCFQGSRDGAFPDVDCLTMFPDYRYECLPACASLEARLSVTSSDC